MHTELNARVRVPTDYPWEVLRLLATDVCTQLGNSEDLSEILSIVRSRDPERIHALAKKWSLQCIDLSLVGETRYQLSSLIRKYPLSSDKGTLRRAALQKLEEAEISCSAFNTRRWKSLFVDGYASPFLLDSREFIEKVVGYFPNLDWLASRHGPGADTDSHGLTSPYFKYESWPYHVTRQAKGHAQQLILSDERWLGALEDSYRERNHIEKYEILDWTRFWDSVFVLEESNRITTVPKDGRTDRPIAIEPRMNVMLQLGIEGVIRSRLKRWGINLDSQQRNQELACEGSIRDDADTPVTFDLSNASDTVSLRIVKLLFPDPWYRLLVALRSPCGIFPDGRRLRYSKLSSMGNGATFAVEALVFASACYAASKYTYGCWRQDLISVFGDDIIVPRAAAALTRTLLESYGFTINETKSFINGNRRESCGTDWIAGTNVRPVFLKERPDDVMSLLNDLNRLKRWASLHHVTLPTLEPYLMRFLPRWAQTLFGPLSDTEFDGWIHSADRSHIKHGDAKHPWTYTWRAVQSTPVVWRRRSNFLFRKLMTSLRPTQMEEPFLTRTTEGLLRARHLKSGGSCFDLLRRDPRASMSARYCHEWQTEYHEVVVRSERNATI